PTINPIASPKQAPQTKTGLTKNGQSQFQGPPQPLPPSTSPKDIDRHFGGLPRRDIERNNAASYPRTETSEDILIPNSGSSGNSSFGYEALLINGNKKIPQSYSALHTGIVHDQACG